MSTKIHNGYRLAPGTDLFDFAAAMRAVMNPIRDRLDARLLIRSATLAIDGADLTGRPRPTMPLLDAMTTFDQVQMKASPDSLLHDPHRFEIAVGRDDATGRLLVRLYTDQPEFRTAWEAMEQVEPYGYWDNADPDDEATEAEWDERCAAWERVMPGAEPPVACMAMLTLRAEAPHDAGMIALISGAADTHRDLFLAGAPTLADRAAAATRLLVASVARDHGADDVETLRRSAARTAPAHLVAMVEPLLDPDAPEAVLTGHYALDSDGDQPPVREVDTGPVRAAIVEWL